MTEHELEHELLRKNIIGNTANIEKLVEVVGNLKEIVDKLNTYENNL